MSDLTGTGYSLDDLAKMVTPEGEADDDSNLLGAQKFNVVIECEDETEQVELLTEFEDRGLNCRAMMV
jgi:hypothetical protein